ncbi:hypothetical protein BOTBODRAFT_498709 [Botryobasidium botryosum FD-172 SS1]|uniref:Uncharacterized protein n=1 Tax=Botryobasidium botryosum (strain FD-172 SS1) TaxID=930990 RepID=A0A067ME37_BOTB1|nr:hypothetical protein BOTBODRAFT_498709 [Botryobasidium botryosum FD-172 SS1]
MTYPYSTFYDLKEALVISEVQILRQLGFAMTRIGGRRPGVLSPAVIEVGLHAIIARSGDEVVLAVKFPVGCVDVLLYGMVVNSLLLLGLDEHPDAAQKAWEYLNDAHSKHPYTRSTPYLPSHAPPFSSLRGRSAYRSLWARVCYSTRSWRI